LKRQKSETTTFDILDCKKKLQLQKMCVHAEKVSQVFNDFFENSSKVFFSFLAYTILYYTILIRNNYYILYIIYAKNEARMGTIWVPYGYHRGTILHFLRVIN